MNHISSAIFGAIAAALFLSGIVIIADLSVNPRRALQSDEHHWINGPADHGITFHSSKG